MIGLAGAQNRPRECWLVLLTGVLAALPVIAASTRAISLGWTPSSDDGVIALRAYDVFSAHPPLVGQYSQSSSLISVPVYSLGPMLYWVLAVPAHIGAGAIVVTMGVISTSSLLGVVAVAHRRGGRGFMFLVAAGVVMALHSLPADVPFEVWNTWAGLIPFIALIFLSWTVACGDFKLLPLLIVVASYVIQCDLTYVAPVLGCITIAFAGTLLEWQASHKDGQTVAMGRWLVAACIALLLCWIAPLTDQLAHSPGNLRQVARLATSGHAVLGSRNGAYAAARAIGFPPLWLASRRTPAPYRNKGDLAILLLRAKRAYLDTNRGPPLFTDATALLLIGCLAAALITGLRRRRRDIAAAAALSIALSLAVGVTGRSVPAGNLGFAASYYVLTWTSPVGMFVYVVLAWSVWELCRPRRLTPSANEAVRWLAAVGGLCVLSVLVANRSVDGPDRLPPRVGTYEAIRAITSRVIAAIDRRDSVLLDVPNTLGEAGLTFQSAIAYAFRRDGIRFAVPPRVSTAMGDQYCPRSSPYSDIVTISEGTVAPEGTTLLAGSATVTVTLARAPSLPSRRDEARARREVDRSVVSRCR